MPIIAHIRFLLTAEGLNYFPTWFDHVAIVVKQQPGFIAYKYAPDPKEKNVIHAWIEFESVPMLDQWAETDSHQHLLDELHPYLQKPLQSVRYEIAVVVSK